MKGIFIIVCSVALMASGCSQKPDIEGQNEALMAKIISDLNQENWAETMPAYMTAEDFKQFQEIHTPFRTAFPDYHFEPDVIAASGDTVVAVGTVTVTHKGELGAWHFKGIIPDGRQYKWKEVWVSVLKEGKFAGGYQVNDNLAVIDQLGIKYPPESAEKSE